MHRGNDAAKAPERNRKNNNKTNSVTFSEGGRLGTEDLTEDKQK